MPVFPARDHYAGIDPCRIQTAALADGYFSAAVVEIVADPSGHSEETFAVLGRDLDGQIRLQLPRAPDGFEQEVAQRINDQMHELHIPPVLLIVDSHFQIVDLRRHDVSSHERHDAVVTVVDNRLVVMLSDYLGDIVDVVIEPIGLGIEHALISFEWDLAGDTQRLSPVGWISGDIDTSALFQNLAFRRIQEIEEELDDILEVPAPLDLGHETIHALLDV